MVLDGGAVEDVAHVVEYALAGHLQETLFHGPETEEGETGIEGVGDLMLLFVAHHRCHDVGVVTAQSLHIDAHGDGVDGTGCGLMTVTKTEKDTGMADERWLAMVTEGECRRLIDAMLHLECMLQQTVGCHGETLVVLLPVAKGMAAPLLADGGKGDMKVELVYLLVDVNHDFGVTGCNLNLVCVARCRMKIATASMRYAMR